MLTARPSARRLVFAAALLALTAPLAMAAAASSDPAPGSPAYIKRDAQNMADAYGRQTAKGDR